MFKTHIIAIETGNEPHAIRAAAEWWGASVTVTWVGNSGQIVDYLSSGSDHELIIISGHGDERGLLLPELAAEVAGLYPYNKVIQAADFGQFLQLRGNTVISLACLGGMSQLADAFLAGGARYYIGPIDYPDGSATLMYVLDFLYNHICHSHDVMAAHHIASRHEDDRQQFKLYTMPQGDAF